MRSTTVLAGSNRTGAYEIWVMDGNGTDEHRLTQLGTRSLFPDFSPNGDRVAFDAPSVVEGATDLWRVSSAGGTPTRVTDTPGVAERLPVWSPDGHTLLYVAGPPDESSARLWTLDLRTGLRAQLTFDATFKDQTADWSPDGTVIAYHADDDIWRMGADGSDQVNLTETPGITSSGPRSHLTARRSPSPARAGRCRPVSATSR